MTSATANQWGYWQTGNFGSDFRAPAQQAPISQDRTVGWNGYGYQNYARGSWGRDGWNSWAWNASCLKVDGWTPAQLFGGGAAGAWYDIQDIASMWEDSGQTTPASVGNPVGYVTDKSGNGNHLTQATAGKRPILRFSGSYYLEFDGVDDVLTCSTANMRITGDLTIIAAAQKDAGSSYGAIAACQTNAGTVNAYEYRFSNHATVAQPELVDASGASNEAITASGPNGVGTLAAPHVFSLRRLAATSGQFSCDQLRESSQGLTLTPTSDGSSAFAIGNRSSDSAIPLDGRIYGLVVLAAYLNDATLGQTETYLTPTVPLAYSLAADVGSYSITGTATGLKFGHVVAASVGSYTISGQTVGLSRTRALVAAPGSYSVTGTATALRIARKLAAAVGSYSITGQTVGLAYGRKLAAAVGGYAITGTATSLRIARKLAANVGSYSISGQTVALKVARRLAAAVGSYAITGQTVGLIVTRKLAAAVGVYALTGTAVALQALRRITAAPGAYVLSGSTVTLIYVPSTGSAGKVNVRVGLAWVEKPLKVWTGAAWVEKPLKYWDGAAWVLA